MNDELSRARNIASHQAPLLDEFSSRIIRQNHNGKFTDKFLPMLVAKFLHQGIGSSLGKRLSKKLSNRS